MKKLSLIFQIHMKLEHMGKDSSPSLAGFQDGQRSIRNNIITKEIITKRLFLQLTTNKASKPTKPSSDSHRWKLDWCW